MVAGLLPELTGACSCPGGSNSGLVRLPALVADWGAGFDLVCACWYLVDRLAGQAPMPVSTMLYCGGRCGTWA